jgi:hypothetical protein
MHNRRSLLTSAVATFFGVASCTTANADEAVSLPIYLHIYSNTRGSTYDQDRQNRRRSRSTVSDWVRVVTVLIVPDQPVFIRLPGGRDPDITISGRVDRRGSGGLHASLNIAWDDSYITEQHEVSGKLAIGELHPSSTIQCRYVFSHSKDPYDALDLIFKKADG